jgi:YD repeat-containing protein
LRETRGQSTFAASYNSLNQLVERNWGGKLDVYGRATSTNVLVGGMPATIYSGAGGTNFYLGGQTVGAGSNALSIVAWQGTNATESVRTVWMSRDKPESFTHDAKGNMLSDGYRQFVWNDENRLVAVENLTNYPGLPRRRSEFVYDGQGRMCKRVDMSDWTGSSWSQTNVTWQVRDGYRIFVETTANATNAHLWGLDLGGGLETAGGIGGLLCVARHSTPDTRHDLPVFDGNGNVTALVNTNGAITARYDYDPFGRLLAA